MTHYDRQFLAEMHIATDHPVAQARVKRTTVTAEDDARFWMEESEAQARQIIALDQELRGAREQLSVSASHLKSWAISVVVFTVVIALAEVLAR